MTNKQLKLLFLHFSRQKKPLLYYWQYYDQEFPLFANLCMATGSFLWLCTLLTTLFRHFLLYNFFIFIIIILLFSAHDKSWLLRDITFSAAKNYLSLVPVLFYEKTNGWMDMGLNQPSMMSGIVFLILYIMIIMMSLMNYGSLSNFELCSRRFFLRDFFRFVFLLWT